MEDTFPDVSSMSDKELKELIDELTDDERELSYRRRLLHGKIDILRAELVNRLKAKREAGDALISGQDVQQLTDILLGKVAGAGRRRGLGGRRWPCTAPSADSSTPRVPTTARSAARTWPVPRARTHRRWRTRSARPASTSRSTSRRKSTRPGRRSSSAPAADAPARASPSTAIG